METLEKFNRRVIELIHGLPYEEACLIEYDGENKMKNFKADPYCVTNCGINNSNGGNVKIFTNGWKCEDCGAEEVYPHNPITIGRVLYALKNSNLIINDKVIYDVAARSDGMFLFEYVDNCEVGREWLSIIKIHWKLTKENGQECTSKDQEEETIKKLYNLIK